MNSRRFIVAPDAEGAAIVAEQLIALEGTMSALGRKRTWAAQGAMPSVYAVRRIARAAKMSMQATMNPEIK
jgi:hypothetical protein